MPTTEYKEARTCACGYTTMTMSNWSVHKKRCQLVNHTSGDKERIASLEQQLAAVESASRRETNTRRVERVPGVTGKVLP